MALSELNCILEARGISKYFPGVIALKNVDIRVNGGRVHVLMGENGAGKSTLMNILSGLYTCDEGEIFYCGRRLEKNVMAGTLKENVAMIHQELALIPDLTIEDNLFLGNEITKTGGLFLSKKEMRKHAAELLQTLGIKNGPREKIRSLSVSERQMVEIAKALNRNATVMIMDEPTSALSDKEVDLLFAKIEELKANGMSIIYITHKMDEIFRIADDISVLRDGCLVDSGPAEKYTTESLIALMVGRSVDQVFPKEHVEIGTESFVFKGLTRHGSFRDVSFSVRRGEILGISGLMGAGRTEVARAIFGLDRLDAGEITYCGERISIQSPVQAMQYGIAMVTEDRKGSGLVLCRSIRENIALPNLPRFQAGPFISRKKENNEVNAMVKALGVKANSSETLANTLSGGNQQKVVLAKWMLQDLKLLILDEPTRGIDVGAKYEIYKLMMSLVRRGVAIIMISSELPEILGLSDRILIMGDGRAKGLLNREEADSESIMHLAVKENN